MPGGSFHTYGTQVRKFWTPQVENSLCLVSLISGENAVENNLKTSKLLAFEALTRHYPSSFASSLSK
jgi:hypothetical protein